MKPHVTTIAEGNEIRPEFVGAKVELNRATTVAEGIASGQFENEEAIMAAATSQRLIAQRQIIREVLAKDAKVPEGGRPATLEDAAREANAYKYGAPRETKPAKPLTEKGAAKSAASKAGHALFLRYRDDGKFRKYVDGNGGLEGFGQDRAAFDTWLKVNPAPAAASTSA